MCIPGRLNLPAAEPWLHGRPRASPTGVRLFTEDHDLPQHQSGLWAGARGLCYAPVMMSSLALWRDRRGRVSALRIAVLAFLAVPVALAAQPYLTDRVRRAADQRSHPSRRLLGAGVPAGDAGGDAARPDRALQRPDRCAAHARGRHLRLCRDPYPAVCRRPDVRSPEGRDRDRAAALSHHRVHRAHGARRPGGDVDRRHGAPAGQRGAGSGCTSSSMASRCSR